MRRRLGVLVALVILAAFGLTPTAQAATNGKMLVIIFENKTRALVEKKAPFTAGIGTTYGRATNAHSVADPSLPNYFMLAMGSTFGITDDGGVSRHAQHGQTIWGNALAHNKAVKVWAEAATSNCQQKDGGLYRVRHVLWPYALDERATCGVYDVPMGNNFAQALNTGMPTLSWLIPSMGHDGHAPYSTIQDGDNWLRGLWPSIVNSTDFRNGMTVVITWDEGKDTDDNIAFIVAQKDLSHKTVTTSFNHHDFYKWMLRIGGTTGGGADAGTLFGL